MVSQQKSWKSRLVSDPNPSIIPNQHPEDNSMCPENSYTQGRQRWTSASLYLVICIEKNQRSDFRITALRTKRPPKVEGPGEPLKQVEAHQLPLEYLGYLSSSHALPHIYLYYRVCNAARPDNQRIPASLTTCPPPAPVPARPGTRSRHAPPLDSKSCSRRCPSPPPRAGTTLPAPTSPPPPA